PLRMPRNLRPLPRPQVRIEFAPKLQNFLLDPLQLRFLAIGLRKPPQLLDVPLQPLDFFLPLERRSDFLSFVSRAHDSSLVQAVLVYSSLSKRVLTCYSECSFPVAAPPKTPSQSHLLRKSAAPQR